ncbi:MAG: sigma-70 family RNA polymerase sigma factor [Deltaproteobacteria bacterium]|nr:sigma-70 family RNA polymerase sigma factor [Deltaproteobacteria bacterium]
MGETELADRDLVDRAKAGDRPAFTLLVQRYQKRAFAVAYGMLHNRDDALDVVQDAFVKVHKHIGAFQGNASFYTWLYRIVANLCIDVRRRRGRRPEVAFEEAIKPDETAAAGVDVAPHHGEANPVDNLTRRELRREMGKALDGLSENHRLILLLREVEGLSYEDLARVLKISKGTVMSRLFHARKNMQKALRPYLGLKPGAGLSGAPAEADQGEEEERALRSAEAQPEIQ